MTIPLSLDGMLTPVGEITEILIEGDNPGGTLTPFGTLTWQADFRVDAPDLGGILTPTGELGVSSDATCFPASYACVAEPEPAFDCQDVCEPNEVPAPPSVELGGVLIPVGQLVEDCPETPMECCLLCGDVSPEGNVEGDIACMYEWTTADVASLDHPIWAKLTGSGNTGWGPLYGLPGVGENSVRVGPLADAISDDSIAIGNGAQAQELTDATPTVGSANIAIGKNAIAYSKDSVVIGRDSSDDNEGDFLSENSVVVGAECFAGSYGNVVIGFQAAIDHLSNEAWDLGLIADETAYNSIAIGFGAYVKDAQSVAIGEGATCFGTCDEAIGLNATCHHSLSIALGSTSDARQQNCIAIGFGAQAGWTDVGDPDTEEAIGIGLDVIAAAKQSVAIGSRAAVDTSTASQAAAAYGIAIGADSLVKDHIYGIALGNFASVNADNQFMVGSNDSNRLVKEFRFNGGGAGSPERCPNVVFGNAARPTNSTEGFPYIPTCAGTPTGTPHSYSGTVPLIYDTNNNKLYAYNGGWKQVTFA